MEISNLNSEEDYVIISKLLGSSYSMFGVICWKIVNSNDFVTPKSLITVKSHVSQEPVVNYWHYSQWDVSIMCVCYCSDWNRTSGKS